MTAVAMVQAVDKSR